MEFQNKTVYSRRTLEKLNQTVDWSLHHRDSPIYRALFMVVPVAFFASGAIIIREQGPNPIAIAEIVLALLLMFWAVGLYRFRALMAAVLVVKGDPEYQTDFGRDGFTVTDNSSGQTIMKDVGYDRVWRLCETREFLVIMLNKHHGYALSRSGFAVGTVEDCKAFLRRKTGLEFTYFNI